VEKYAEEVAGR